MLKFFNDNRLRSHSRVHAGALIAIMAGALAGCPHAPATHPVHSTAATRPMADVRWKVSSARRQSAYVSLNLPVIVWGMKITVGDPMRVAGGADIVLQDASAAWQASQGGGVDVYSTRIVHGIAEGPMVDQLTGDARMSADGGSYLVPIDGSAAEGGMGGKVYRVAEPMPVCLKVTVPAAIDAGEYRFPLTIETPGRAGAAGQREESTLAVEVADLAVPTQPRVLRVMTTTGERLAALFPETFGALSAQYLDRGNADHQAAMAQLDALVRAAQQEAGGGLALFVEDLGPIVRVDEHGLVTLDWDAYDRVMQPYMDGTAFADRVPQPVWLAPAPPRRIRDSATQLWQYIDACARHFAARGWVATPAFLHPALAEWRPADADPGSPATAEAAALRLQVADMLRLHMPREMLAVTTPDGARAIGEGGVPHGQLWTVEDGDARLPPAGLLGNAWSVRTWPWMCVARAGAGGNAMNGVRGFVWRDALATPDELKEAATRKPLLVVGKIPEPGIQISDFTIFPSLRMVWLSDGLNDSALLGLLEKRSDPALVNEVLAGVVGRTGMTGAVAGGTDAVRLAWPEAPPGFLYAGWPSDKALWQQVTPMLQRLVLANDPGTRAQVKPEDPLAMAAKLWLAQSRRPVARVAGYDFAMRQGREGDIVDARIELIAENPVEAAAEFEMRLLDQPGDFDLPPIQPSPEGDVIRRRSAAMGAVAAGRIVLNMAGHLDSVLKAPGMQRLELTERHAGAMTRVPVAMPVYRTHAVETPPKLDGNGGDWLMDAQLKVYGEMTAGLRYLSRPDLLAGQVREDASPAIVRWTYDADYIYMYARCSQDAVTDERNTQWPVEARRWWGGDGLQVQLAEVGAFPSASAVPPAQPVNGGRVIQVAFKPAGVAMVKTGRVVRTAAGEDHMVWTDGPPNAGAAMAGVKYGIVIEKREGRVAGYAVEAAIPRAWVKGDIAGINAPAWRLNVLRHRAGDLACMSWSGPLVDDEDVAMMGLLVGE